MRSIKSFRSRDEAESRLRHPRQPAAPPAQRLASTASFLGTGVVGTCVVLRSKSTRVLSPRPLLVTSLVVVFSFAAPGAQAREARSSATAPGPRLTAFVGPFGHPKPEAHPGYLGVSILDLDGDQAKQLHLKDAHGVLIFSIDRDAPAASAGLRARDVILEFDGHHVDNMEQLRHRLSDVKAGTTIKLRISRDGVQQTVSVQLGDEQEIARRAWEQHVGPSAAVATAAPSPSEPGISAAASPAFVPPRGKLAGSSFLGVFSVNALYTGAEIDPLSTQLANYFGVQDGAGLLVRTVNGGSPAALAGLVAGDVILRVNNQPVVSRVDWIKQLRANRGRPIQLSVMRNRHEQTLTMTATPGKKG